MARNYKDWIRPVEDWKCKYRHPRKKFHSLARHLLAKYDLPPFFDTVFFQGTTARAQREQRWFKHVSMGQNIRTAGVPMRLTKRMAHLFMQDKHTSKPINQILRRAQFSAYGGGYLSSWEFSNGPLSETFEHEEFWETVVQFLANQSFLDVTYINAVIDYIRNQKFTPQRIPQPDGSIAEGSPRHPNFCIKGRSINKLIREVDIWHQHLTGMEDVALETWDSSRIGEFEHIELDAELKRNIQWTVHELITSQQLYAEGRIMHHCAGSYVKRCASGARSIWSLRALDLDAAEENQYQEHVLTIEVDNKQKAVVQHTGKYNLKPFGKKHLVAERKAGNVYLLLLRRAPTLMRMWMDKVNLAHGRT